MARQRVIVTLVEARKLKDIGKGDLYFRVNIDKLVGRTKARSDIDKTGSCKINEQFNMDVGERTSSILLISLLNLREDVLGELALNFADAAANKRTPQGWFVLQKKTKGRVGEIFVKLAFQDIPAPPTAQVRAVAAAPPAALSAPAAVPVAVLHPSAPSAPSPPVQQHYVPVKPNSEPVYPTLPPSYVPSYVGFLPPSPVYQSDAHLIPALNGLALWPATTTSSPSPAPAQPIGSTPGVAATPVSGTPPPQPTIQPQPPRASQESSQGTRTVPSSSSSSVATPKAEQAAALGSGNSSARKGIEVEPEQSLLPNGVLPALRYVRVAIIGAGLFATESHFPAIWAMRDLFDLRAIHSNSKASAEALAAKAQGKCIAVFHGDDGLTQLLSCEDIDAVIITVPIRVMPVLVQRALAAGKHVLSEKPVAPDTATARRLIELYNTQYREKGLIWAVAENYRFERGLVRAREMVREIGPVTGLSITALADVGPDSKFAMTKWRRGGGGGGGGESSLVHDGGFVLDGGVHYAAAVDMLCGDGVRVKSVAGFVRCQRDYLHLDTADAVIQLDNGASGTIRMSWASPDSAIVFHVVGTTGAVQITRHSHDGAHGYKCTLKRTGVAPAAEFFPYSGIKDELTAFATAVLLSTPNSDQDPEAALWDLALIKGMLESSRGGGVPVSLESLVNPLESSPKSSPDVVTVIEM